MPDGLLPSAAPAAIAGVVSPQAVVEAFLAALGTGDVETALALIDDDIVYVNVGLPTIRGRDEVEKVFRLLDRPGTGFEVYLHSILAEGPMVLTERTDVMVIGRVRIQFWAWGHFEVHDGRITLWRDSFDMLDILRGTVRGILGLALPSVLPVAPGDPHTPPGR